MSELFARIDALEAALSARLVALEEHRVGSALVIGKHIARLEGRLERLESARIAAPVAPESVVNVSEVSQEPGNATEAHSGRKPVPNLLRPTIYADDPEVAAALRVYRKVQALIPCGYDGGCLYDPVAKKHFPDMAAWLKEGEA